MVKTNVTDIKTPEFLGYLHSFRGLAILKIVLGHAVAAACIGAYGVFDVSYPVLMISEIFYHDSTIYFAVISGLLFTKILKPKGYSKFYKSKLINILLPYIFFTLVFTLITIKFKNTLSFEKGLGYYFSKAFMNLLFGKASFVLWYIPVLIFLYMVTPLLGFLQKTNQLTKVLFLIIMGIPLFVSRIPLVSDYSLKLETMIYFMGAYAVGMYLGADLEAKLGSLKKHKNVIMATSVLATVVLFYLYVNDIDMYGKVSLKETFFYIQKIGFSIIFIMMFKKLGEKQPNWMKPVARDSFSIYFMHGYILYASYPLFKFVFGTHTLGAFNVGLMATVLFIYTVILSMLVVRIFKLVFRKKSRMIVGA